MAESIRTVLFRQNDVISWHQALAAGLSPDRIRWQVTSGRWQRLHPRAYLTHSGPASAEQREWAALLYAGPDACLSCHTAAHRDGLTGHESVAVHVLLPWARRLQQQPGLLIHRSRVLDAEHDVHPAREPRRSRLPRSVLDIADHARSNDDARAVLAAAVQQRLVTAHQLRAMLLRLGPRPRRNLLLVTLADVEGGSQALPELQALDLLRRAGLPLPDARQKRLRYGRYYLDLWWKAQRIAVEIDGSAHLLATNWWADLHRQNEITLDGRLVLRFPSFVVRERPQQFVDQMARALGVTHRCSGRGSSAGPQSR